MKDKLGYAWFKPEGLFGWAIVVGRLFHFKSLGKWSHVECYDPFDFIVDRNGQKSYWCFSAYEKEGVRGKYIALDYVGASREEFYVEPAKLEAIWNWTKTQEGLKYGWREIRGFVFPWRSGKPDTWICSEICCHIGQMAGLIDPAVRCERVSPTDLWNRLKPFRKL